MNKQKNNKLCFTQEIKYSAREQQEASLKHINSKWDEMESRYIETRNRTEDTENPKTKKAKQKGKQ